MGDDGEMQARLLDAAVDLMGRAGRGGTVRVRGHSMRPTLSPGEVLAVRFSPDEIRRGDLLLFRQADYLVVHRFLGPARTREGRSCLRTRGDALIALDPPLDRANVIGTVVAVQRDGEWIGLEGSRARLYARAVALHDLVWAAAGVAAVRVGRRLARLGFGARLARLPAALDWRLLGLAHRLLFHRLHPAVPPPEQAPESPPEGEATS
jgi:hypothetical protein